MKIAGILEKIMEMHRFLNNSFFVCLYKMVDINAKTFAENCIHTMSQLKKKAKNQFYG